MMNKSNRFMIHTLSRQGNHVTRRDFLKLGSASVVAGSLAACAGEGGEFPSGPVRIIVPYGTGGGTDLEARALAPYVQQHLGVSILVENQPGADGRVALSRFVRETPDGYTLAVYGVPSIILGELLFSTSYSVRDFSHIYAWTRENQVIVVAAGRWENFEALLSESRTRTLTAGVPYLTSASRLAGLMLAEKTGVEFSWIPFGGSGAAMAALLGGHVDCCISAATTCLSLVRSQELDPLLVFSREQDPIYPDVPTQNDLGYDLPDLPIVRGAVGPPAMEAQRLALLEDTFARSVSDPTFREHAANMDTPLAPLSSEEYRQVVEDYYPRIERYQNVLLESERA